MASSSVDAIVVGGGLAGLAAATYLARGGMRVVLFEKAEVLGGRARTRVQDGFHLNLGPHALSRGGRGLRVLHELGVPVEGRVPSTSGSYAVHGGALHTLPVGFVSLLATGLLGPRDKMETARILAGLGRLDTVALDGITLSDWLQNRVHGPMVRQLLAAIVRVATYVHDPERMSVGAALAQVQRALAGVLYLHGGWQTLVEGLRRAAREAGVDIHAQARVAEVLPDPSARGVRLADGVMVMAPAVLIAGSPAMAASLSESSALARWAADATPLRAACLDVALSRLPRPRARFALGIDEPLYFSVHSATARLAPDSAALIHVARYLGPAPASAPGTDTVSGSIEAQLTSLLDALQPGWRDLVVHRRFVPDLVVSNAVVTAAGGGLAGRPGPAVSDAPGIYVAGDWVGSEGMLADASLASARAAAAAILGGHRRAEVA